VAMFAERFNLITAKICCSGSKLVSERAYPLSKFAVNWLYEILKVQS